VTGYGKISDFVTHEINRTATTSAHFIDKQWNLTTCVIESAHFSAHFLGHHTGILISQKVKEALSKFDFSTDQVSTIVHDEAVNAALAGGFYIAYPACVQSHK